MNYSRIYIVRSTQEEDKIFHNRTQALREFFRRTNQKKEMEINFQDDYYMSAIYFDKKECAEFFVSLAEMKIPRKER